MTNTHNIMTVSSCRDYFT